MDTSNDGTINHLSSQFDVLKIPDESDQELIAYDSFISDIVPDGISDLGSQSNVSDDNTTICTPTEFSSDVQQFLTRQTSSLSLETKLPIVNKALRLLNESPIPTKKIKDISYMNKKASYTGFNLKRKLRVPMNFDFATVTSSDDACDIIKKMYVKFHHKGTTWAEKVQTLTLIADIIIEKNSNGKDVEVNNAKLMKQLEKLRKENNLLLQKSRNLKRQAQLTRANHSEQRQHDQQQNDSQQNKQNAEKDAQDLPRIDENYQISVLNGIAIDYEAYLKAAQAKTMRRRANLIIDALWSVEQHVTRYVSDKLYGQKKVTPQEYNNITSNYRLNIF
ncbi:hypothetical protein KQX54_013311 [Cotesia glomerata]|uniref:Uncharacterized protein n=1 Tax=Cotesia glomerata TaxID=32391 RepID=A0AAV7IXU1_COTGL|nr:hypothetical protein KQX54_013311 [Cotesia glomerata]